MTVWLWVSGAVIAMIVTVAAYFTKKPVKSLLGGAVQGFCALVAVNLTSVYTGVSLGLTAFTTYVCAVLGLPGVITLLLLRPLAG